MGETENQYYLSLEAPGYFKKAKKKHNHLIRHIVMNLKSLEIKIVEHVGKGVHRKLIKIRLIIFWKSWIWDQSLPEKHEMFFHSWIGNQDLPENMKWTSGKMEPISFKKYEMAFLNLWNFETKKPRNVETNTVNQETKEPRNQEPLKPRSRKPRNFETKTPRNQETKKPIK